MLSAIQKTSRHLERDRLATSMSNRPFEFEYQRVETLPQLAWGACLKPGNRTITVYHGPAVETSSKGFIEGAWDGQFDAFDIESATIVSGTGAFLSDGQVSFLSSTDRLSPIFSITKDRCVYISNSPVFALSMAQVKPHETYPFYTYDFLKIWRGGLYCLSGNLRTNSAEHLSVHFSTIMTINTRSAVSYKTYVLCAAPEDYTAYRSKLIDGTKQVFKNASDPQRRRAYKPVAAISQGYDSTASAVLACLAGCTDTVTYFDSGHSGPYEDSGLENAARLGMTCKEYDRWAYLKRGDLVEADFGLYATATSTPLVSMETQLAGRILVSGHFGDTIWGKEKASFCDNLSQPWARFVSGVNQIEFRLRVGYLSFSPVLIGARHNLKIHGITISDEMQPWSVPGSYDRPIPRRLAEEAGLPRDSFGMRKKGSSHAHLVNEKNLSKKALAHYQRFVKEQVQGKQKLSCFFWRALACSKHFFWKIKNLKRSRYLLKSSKLQRTFPYILNRCPILVAWPFMFTFQWSFSLLAVRYQLPAKKEFLTRQACDMD